MITMIILERNKNRYKLLQDNQWVQKTYELLNNKINMRYKVINCNKLVMFDSLDEANCLENIKGKVYLISFILVIVNIIYYPAISQHPKVLIS